MRSAEHERPGEPGDERRVRDAHRDHGRDQALAEQGDRHDRDQQRREGEQDVEDPAEHGVDPAAAPAGQRGRAGCRATVETITTTSGPSRAVRAPKIRRLRVSRPSASAPSQCAGLGDGVDRGEVDVVGVVRRDAAGRRPRPADHDEHEDRDADRSSRRAGRLGIRPMPGAPPRPWWGLSSGTGSSCRSRVDPRVRGCRRSALTTTKAVTTSSTIACTTGKSSRSTDCTSSEPMPGEPEGRLDDRARDEQARDEQAADREDRADRVAQHVPADDGGRG